MLGELAEENGLPLRKKKYGWNSHANKVTRKTYAQLSGLIDQVSVEEIECWDKDYNLTLIKDLMLKIPASYEDLDPSTPGAEAEMAEEVVLGSEKDAVKTATNEDNPTHLITSAGETGLPNPVHEENIPPEEPEVPVSQVEVNTLRSLEKKY